jgi:hypothetical protein
MLTFFKCKYHSVFERDWLCYSMPNKYLVNGSNSSTLSICGTPNNGTFPLTTPPADTGLSLIGNPYPSSLNVAISLTKTCIILFQTRPIRCQEPIIYGHTIRVCQETTLVQMITILVIYQGLQVSHCQELGTIRHQPGL